MRDVMLTIGAAVAAWAFAAAVVESLVWMSCELGLLIRWGFM